MKKHICFLIMFAVLGCDNRLVESFISSSSDTVQLGVMQGRVYSIGSTAVTQDWSPPPLEGISTIIVLDENQIPVREIITDSEGRFHISIEPGVYFLIVKDAPIQSTPYLAQPITGPFRVTQSQSDSAYAYFDSGMR